jgi:gliding motility-associated-like protein
MHNHFLTGITKSGARKTLLIAVLVIGSIVSCLSQSEGKDYMIPDIGAPGLATKVEIISKYIPLSTDPTMPNYFMNVANFYNGDSALFLNNPGDPIRIVCTNPLDYSRVTIGPITVSWLGQCLSTHIFVHSNLTPNSYDWQLLDSTYKIPIAIQAGLNIVPIDTFYILQPYPTLYSTSPSITIGSGQVNSGKRSPRGAMIFEDFTITGTAQAYTVSTADCDPYLEGNQGYLPVNLISANNITIGPNAVLSIDATLKNAGPGGGGGGAGSIDGDGGNGFTAGGYSCTPNGTTIWNESGESSGKIIPGPQSNNVALRGSFSINGIPGGYGRCDQGGGGGSGHPLGASGAYGATYAQSLDPSAFPGMFGGGSAGGEINIAPDSSNMPFGGGGGGNGSIGQIGEANYTSNAGRVTGNQYIVPLSGGSGGGAGNVWSLYKGGSGGGGGGSICLFAHNNTNISQVTANGGDGTDGYVPYASQIGLRGASGGGGGSGGCIMVGAKKQHTGLNIFEVSGGDKGLGDQQNTLISHDGGIGGSGRIRLDGNFSTYNILSDSASFGRGPTTDTSSYVNPQFTITGTGNGNPVKLYLKHDGGFWFYGGTATNYTGDTWSINLSLNSTYTKYYLIAAQQETNPVVDTMQWEPKLVLSQAATNILEINQVPILEDDSTIVFENDSVVVPVLANDIDPNGNILTLSIIGLPLNGTASILNGDSILYIPVPGFYGLDTVVLEICDGMICDTSYLFIKVLEENFPPVTASDYGVTNEDTPLEFNVILNDTDPDPNDTLIVTAILADPGYGSASIVGDSTLLYIPDLNYFGPDYIVYETCNNHAYFPCTSDTLFIIINPINDTPYLLNDLGNPTLVDSSITIEDTPIEICFDFYDIENDSVFIDQILLGGYGDLILGYNDTCIYYTPLENFNGLDSFRLSLCDDNTMAACDTINIYINVLPENDAPVIVEPISHLPVDTLWNVVIENQSTEICPELIDIDSDSLFISYLQFISNQGIGNGNLSISASDTCFIYQPDPFFEEGDTLVLVVSDGFLEDTVLVVIDVIPENNPPYVLDEGSIAEELWFLAYEDSVVALCIEMADDNMDNVFITSFLSLSDSASISFSPDTDTCLLYQPVPDFNGEDSVLIVICDDGTPSLCESVLIYIEVEPANDSLFIEDNTYILYDTTWEDTDKIICFNIFDLDDDDFYFSNQSYSITGNGIMYQTILEGDSCIHYQPNMEFTGTDTLVVFFCDYGSPSICDSIVLVIEVLKINDPPVAYLIEVLTNVDEAVDIDLTEFVYDSDDTLTSLSFSVEEYPQFGTVNTELDFGLWSYTPEIGYIGNDTMRYKVCDIYDSCAYANIYITVSYDLYFPNAISPNGDGYNDYFQILGLEKYVDEVGLPLPNEFKVFNRWGGIVFSIKDYHNDDSRKRWDGKSNTSVKAISTGSYLPEGTYYYYFEMEKAGIKKSSFVILKY